MAYNTHLRASGLIGLEQFPKLNLLHITTVARARCRRNRNGENVNVR